MKRLLLIAALALAGCATQVMQGYVGKDVSEVVLERGPPINVMDMMVWMPPPGVIATYRHADGSVAKE